MTLLTSKVAKKIAGIEELGTTTGDMDDINRSIRRNRPTTEQTIYDVDDIRNEISKNPVARQAYQRINDQGVDVILTNELPKSANSDSNIGVTCNLSTTSRTNRQVLVLLKSFLTFKYFLPFAAVAFRLAISVKVTGFVKASTIFIFFPSFNPLV